MNKFIKGGVVTRIDILNNSSCLEKYFNLKLYKKIENSYYLKEDILNKNLYSLWREISSLTSNMGDSISDSDSYVLLANADKLLKSPIVLLDDNKRYRYLKYQRNSFEMILIYETIHKMRIRIYLMPIIWDINRLEIESDLFLKTFLNNLIRKSLKNILKDTIWFVIVN